jgi:hypothetical protein
MAERRYSDDEIRTIFARATEVRDRSPRQLPGGEGMSLAELQAIGREAGISPELVSQAARELDQPPAPPPPRLLGIPIGVARTVELDRKLTDAEWEQLVVRLRETFHARGTITEQGSFRSWVNGNLQILVEPTPTGERVRFRTVRGEARGLLTAGLSMIGVSAMLTVISLLTVSGGPGEVLASTTPVGLIGAGLALFSLVRLPSWLRERRTQMDELAESVLRLTASDEPR